MTKKQIKQNFFTFYNRTLNNIKDLRERKNYYVSATESRELLGVINFVWRYDYINDKEREECFNTTFDQLNLAETYLKHLM